MDWFTYYQKHLAESDWEELKLKWCVSTNFFGTQVVTDGLEMFAEYFIKSETREKRFGLHNKRVVDRHGIHMNMVWITQ